MRARVISNFLLLSGICCAAELSLPTVFSDHMVVQRERPVPVWGAAQAGSEITVEFAGQKKRTIADDENRWHLTLDPMAAVTDPLEMQISSRLQSEISNLKFSNVLIGDVWLCSGQSNMQWFMARSQNGEAAIAAAEHPMIRLYNTPLVFAREPQERINGSWKPCTPETVKNFSAVAYYFGRKLSQELNVPIGLLQSAWGGTRIEPWTPPCGFEGIDSLADIRRQIDPMPALDGDPKQERQFPTAIYNGMIHAHIPFAIRGAIWYQGESNHTEGILYVDKTKALLNGWHRLWGYEFPFYFVQIAPFQYGNEAPEKLAEFWEAQSEIVKQIPNTGMAVVSDATTLNNIHPPNKEVPGTRLALLALNKTYGKELVSSGPVFKSLEKEPSGHRLIVAFDAAEGLTTRDGKAPDWFEVAGADGAYKPADAEIKDRSVILSSPEVKNPVAMRFAWHKLAIPNLMNGAGLPASAFRAER